jgi:adenylate cyclase
LSLGNTEANFEPKNGLPFQADPRRGQGIGHSGGCLEIATPNTVRMTHTLPALAPQRPVGAIRALRTASGLVLAVFVTLHLCNHALGSISVDAQEAMLAVLLPVWRSAPGTLLLYSALILHASLGLYALWRRKTLRMPAWELAQLTLGLAVPLLLIPHVFGTRVAAELLGNKTTYHSVIAAIWANPVTMVRQPILVVIVWTHLLIGLHFWLRLRSGYRRRLPVLYPLAVMVPVLALLGFWGAGIELRETRADGAPYGGSAPYGPSGSYAGSDADASPQPLKIDAATRRQLEQSEDTVYAVYSVLLALVLAGRALRRVVRRRGGTYRVHHSNGRVISAPVGHTLLEALRDAGIPHASVCGGRARCTTCRVRVGQGAKALAPPAPVEASALNRIHAERDVRLACQLRPSKNVHITPLLPPHVGPADIDVRRMAGRERQVAVMFVDLRESSRLGEQRMPYDVFFLLNRFFAEMDEALRETGGYYSTFNGDGLMALYGTSSDLARGCRDALHGAIAIEQRLARINAAMAADLREPLRAGIGIHAGDAIIGTMGPPATPILSALGDTVNVAARLEAETKERDCVLVISVACASAAGVDLAEFPMHTVTVRGRSEPVTYYAIHDPADLAALLKPPTTA